MLLDQQRLELLGKNRRRHGGFTLLELVIVMTMLVTVLAVSYQVIVDCLEADRNFDRIALPEKVGAGIMALFRRDLSGTYFRQMGPQIFRVIDEGNGEDATDQLHLISTVPPTPLEDVEESSNEVFELHSLTGVQYFLAPNEQVANANTDTLFRKEMAELAPEGPLDSPGIAYEIYDKVAYLNVECFDGSNWNPDWDSEAQIVHEADEMALIEEEQQGRIGRVSDGPSGGQASDFDNLDPFAPPQLPPTAVPAAVRIEIGIYGGRGNEVDVDRSGEPLLKRFAGTVPLISAVRLPIELNSGADKLSGGFGGGVSDEVSNPTDTLGGGRTPSGENSSKRRPIGGGRRPR